MKLRSWVSWRLLLIGGSLSLFFFSAGVLFTHAILSGAVNEYAAAVARKNERIAILEFFVKSQATVKAEAFASLLAPPVLPESTSLPVPEGASSAVAAIPPKQAISSLAPPVQVAKIKPPESKPQKLAIEQKQAVAPVVSPPVAAAQNSTQAKPAPSDADARYIVGEELFKATASANVEGVSADKAGIARLTADAVVMRSGLSVRVGQIFPSGERLLLVDRENGRIVTNSRQLLVFNLND